MIRRLALLLAAAAAAVALLLPLSADSAHGSRAQLVGTVGPGFTITLKTAAGGKVTKLEAGTYTIAVQDRSSIHNFHLRGPGVNKASSVSFVGSRSWTVRLRRGTYRYQCDPHRSTLRGSFKVA